jgi:hypothetical protein
MVDLPSNDEWPNGWRYSQKRGDYFVLTYDLHEPIFRTPNEQMRNFRKSRQISRPPVAQSEGNGWTHFSFRRLCQL